MKQTTQYILEVVKTEAFWTQLNLSNNYSVFPMGNSDLKLIVIQVYNLPKDTVNTINQYIKALD